MYKASANHAPSCDIIALTVPTSANKHHAVSMYLNSEAKESNVLKNERAMDLLNICQHSSREIFGDVFVGRCHDDELSDVWERIDFTVDDANPNAEWCHVARQPNGGGGLGANGGVAHSLTGSLGNTFARAMMSSQQVQATPMDGREIDEQDEGYTWSQTDDEVEMKFSVASGTKAQYVKVNFQWNAIKVTVAGQTLLQGELGGSVLIDGSTYTIQDTKDGGRELCITLEKDQSDTVWTCAMRNK